MAKPIEESAANSARVFRFNLTGLIVLCLCLVAGSAFVTRRIVGTRTRNVPGPGPDVGASNGQENPISTRKGPWGELLTQDISLERPAEYLTNELSAVQPPVWTFHGMNVAQVKTFFTANGLTEPEAQKALAPDRVSTQGTDTLLKPSDEFIFSLTPEARDRLYVAMRGQNVSLYIESPYYYGEKQLEGMKGDTRVHPDDLGLFRKLVYGGKDVRRFSDYETLMGRIPSLERRMAMAVSLSRQSAVLARLCVRPDTDIDKVAAYWGNVPNVRFIDIRPMLEALKGLPRGGTASVMYLLPPFARERLNTFPPPPAGSEPPPHYLWTTLNFDRLEPDNRFLDPATCQQYLDQHFYEIARPGLCGDVVLFKSPTGQIRHSAVFVADDLVFSKLGKNHTMPWVMMRIADMQALYSNCKIVCLRNKTD